MTGLLAHPPQRPSGTEASAIKQTKGRQTQTLEQEERNALLRVAIWEVRAYAMHQESNFRGPTGTWADLQVGGCKAALTFTCAT